MGRASDAQKADRLNRARMLLRQFDQLPDAVERLARVPFAADDERSDLDRVGCIRDVNGTHTIGVPRELRDIAGHNRVVNCVPAGILYGTSSCVLRSKRANLSRRC